MGLGGRNQGCRDVTDAASSETDFRGSRFQMRKSTTSGGSDLTFPTVETFLVLAPVAIPLSVPGAGW